MLEKNKKEILEHSRKLFTSRKDAGMIHIPNDYSLENALQSAWFIIQEVNSGKNTGYKKALDVCTENSIVQSLFKMVSEGLNPSKKQCSFIMRQSNSTWVLDYQREYQGTVALAKRYSGVKDVRYREIYKDDTYVTEILSDGRKVLKTHQQPITAMDGEIIGAYCVIIDKEGKENLTDMTIAKINISWQQGSMKGKGDVHVKFEDEMAKKTVANRACKPYINSSNDDSILPEEYTENINIKNSISGSATYEKELKPSPADEKPINIPIEVKEETSSKPPYMNK